MYLAIVKLWRFSFGYECSSSLFMLMKPVRASQRFDLTQPIVVHLTSAYLYLVSVVVLQQTCLQN